MENENMTKQERKNIPRVLSISSGKGGVGKSHIVVNLALALSEMGKRILVWDADLGLANIDILLGIQPEYSLKDMLSGERTLDEVLFSAPGGFDLIPAGSGIEELTKLSLDQKMILVERMEQLASKYDYILLDTGAGISSNVIYFNLCANEVILIVVPEPTSLTDGYALIKVLNRKHKKKSFWLLANSVKNEEEGKMIFDKMYAVCDRYLNIRPSSCGSILYDKNFLTASRRQEPLLTLAPDSPGSQSIQKLAGFLESHTLEQQGNEQFEFFKKLMSYRQEINNI